MKKTILYAESTGKIKGGGQYSLYLLIKNINKEKFNPILILHEKGEFYELMRSLNIKIYFVKMRKLKTGNLADVFSTSTEILKLIKKEKVSLVHANSSRSAVYCGIAAKMAGIPMLTHIRVIQKEPVYDWIIAMLSTRIIAVSEAVRRRFSYLPDKKIRVIYNGIDVEEFRPLHTCKIKKELGLSDSLVLLTAGNLVWHKGHEYVLRAFYEVKKEIKNVKLLVCGEGERKEYLFSLASKLGILDDVYFLGNRDDMVEIINTSDVFLTSSFTEAFGRVICEAMACEKPVIGIKAGAIPEIVEDGKTGILCKPKDIKEFAEAIIRLLKDEKLRKEMGKSGRERVEKFFTIERNVKEIENLYAEILYMV